MPFHFQYVMQTLSGKLHKQNRLLAEALASLFAQLLESKQRSGDGWEGLFILFLLARCIAGKHENYFIPDHWFENISVNVTYNSYSNTGLPLSSCKNWAMLKKVILPAEAPTIALLYPSHARSKHLM